MPRIVMRTPTFNEEKTIANVALLSQEYTNNVAVFDDSGTDWTWEIAMQLGADLIRQEKGRIMTRRFRRNAPMPAISRKRACYT